MPEQTLVIPIAEPYPAPPADAVWHGLAGETVGLLAEHTEADPVALLATYLAAVGSMLGRGPYYLVSGRRHGSQLWPVLVGATSSGRKGTSWGTLLPVLVQADPDWAARCIASGLSSGEGLIWAVRDRIMGREPIKERGRVTGHQEVETDPGVLDKRLFVIEEEFAGVMKAIGRENNTLSSLLRLAWDGHTLRTLTKHSPAVATDPHITVMGHITPEELTKYLDSTEAANGFGNRFVWFCVRRARLLPDGGQLDEGTILGLGQQLRAAMEDARQITRVTFDAAAHEDWRAIYGDLTEADPGLLGAMMGRGAPQVLRTALVYAALDGAYQISREHLKAALALWDYSVASVRHIFAGVLGDPIADVIVAALKDRGTLTDTDLLNLFDRNEKKASISKALAFLEGHKVIASGKQERSGPGRPATVWRLVGTDAAG